jgi:predicted DCC family thiol-disulfide oxidoreductase YuxK
VAVFLYDGDCGFCSSCARFLTRYVQTPAEILPWQLADLVALGVTREQCAAAVQWIDDDRVESGPVAIAALLRTATGRSGFAWRAVGRRLGAPSLTVVAWPVYRLIARYRHRLPGGTAACAIATRPVAG